MAVTGPIARTGLLHITGAPTIRIRRYGITSGALLIVVLAALFVAWYSYRTVTAAINDSADAFDLRYQSTNVASALTLENLTLYDMVLTHDPGDRDSYYAIDRQIRPVIAQLAGRLRSASIEGATILADDLANVYPLWTDAIAQPIAEHPRAKDNIDTLGRGQLYISTMNDDTRRVQAEIDQQIDGRIARARQTVFTALLFNTIFAFALGGMSLFIDARRRIAEQAQAEETEERATHDSVTGLPNRVLFKDRVDQALLHYQRYGGALAVLFVDLDGFKAVNDRFGHDAGDEVLRTVAARLQECVRRSDTVSRQGGDEFAILLTTVSVPEEAGAVAQRIIEHVAQPIFVRNVSVSVGASVGIGVCPRHGAEMEALVRRADEAMLCAKRCGKNCWRFAA